MLGRDREGDRARARTDIQDARPDGSAQERQAALDDHLRARPGNERAPVGRQPEPAEAHLAEDMCQRLAGGPPSDQPPQGGCVHGAGEQALGVSLW